MNDYNNFRIPRLRKEIKPEPPERPDLDDTIRDRSTPLLLKIMALILLAVTVLYILNTIFVNPLSELKFRVAIAQSYRIKVAATNYNDRSENTVKVDGNLISVVSKYGESEYYQIDGDVIYQYTQSFSGEWKRSQATELFTGEYNDLISTVDNLLDPRNYERSHDDLFVWRLKEDVNVGNYRNVTLRRKAGKITITANIGFAKVTFTFDRIGMTTIDPPWEE